MGTLDGRPYVPGFEWRTVRWQMVDGQMCTSLDGSRWVPAFPEPGTIIDVSSTEEARRLTDFWAHPLAPDRLPPGVYR